MGDSIEAEYEDTEIFENYRERRFHELKLE